MHRQDLTNRPAAPTARTSHRKAKTGCITCKQRRVKCDESKPGCIRCLSFNGTCGGYKTAGTPQVRNRNSGIPILPKSNSHSLQILCPPSVTATIFKTATEKQFFHRFVNKTAHEICGYFDPQMWTKLVLQACHVNPSIGHCVVAISALSFSRSLQVLRLKSGSVSEHRRFALRQYDGAVKQLRLLAATGNLDLQTILVTNIVLTCFENLYGNYESAAAQIKVGLNLIFSERFACKYKDIDATIVDAFVRLDLQALSAHDTRDTVVHRFMKSYRQDDIDSMPLRFTIMDQAKIYLCLILQRLLHLLSSFESGSTSAGPFMHFIGFFKSGPAIASTHTILDRSRTVDPEIDSQACAHMANLLQWKKAVAPLAMSLRSTISDSLEVTSNDFLVYNTLMLHYHAACIVAASLQLSGVSGLEEIAAIFREMLEIAKIIIAHPLVKHAEFSFTADIQFVCSLYLVACRSPQREIRQSAIGLLLGTPRQEGLWDSRMAGKIAECILKVEDEIEASDGGGNGVYISSRITRVDVEVDLKESKARLVCCTPGEGPDGLVRRDEVVTW